MAIPYPQPMSTPENDRALSCAAVRLWYRIRAAERMGPVTEFELITLVG